MIMSGFQKELIDQLKGIREELHIHNNRCLVTNVSIKEANIDKISKGIEAQLGKFIEKNLND